MKPGAIDHERGRNSPDCGGDGFQVRDLYVVVSQADVLDILRSGGPDQIMAELPRGSEDQQPLRG